MSIKSVIAVASALVMTLTGIQVNADWTRKINAPQLCYQKYVPHTDRNGRPLEKYDPQKSFLPIGMYHFYPHDNSSGINGFAGLADAGFTFGLMNIQALTSEIAEEAVKAGVQVVRMCPTDQEVKTFKNHPALLAYLMDDEPTGQLFNDIEIRFQRFTTARDQIKAIDPNIPVFILDCPWPMPPATSWWIKWNTSGDITCHDNYPIDGKHRSISYENGIGETVALAVGSVAEKKPMWFCAEAHCYNNPVFCCKFPTPDQERCMIYTAFIHGATGLMYFGMDSWVLRVANCVGIAPDPKVKYDVSANMSAISATKDNLQSSRILWKTIVQLNSELNRLRPSLLSQTASVPYEVYMDDKLSSLTPDPLRTLLKVNPDGGYTLLLSNTDDVPLKVKIVFPKADKLTITEFFSKRNEIKKVGNAFEISCKRFDARAFSINF